VNLLQSKKGESKQYVREGGEGSKITFNFCPNCGVAVYCLVDDRPGFIAIPVGAFADSSVPPPTFSAYEDRGYAWADSPEGIVCMG
jgi:hypothetical protein